MVGQRWLLWWGLDDATMLGLDDVVVVKVGPCCSDGVWTALASVGVWRARAAVVVAMGGGVWSVAVVHGEVWYVAIVGADTGYVVFQTEKAKKDAIIAAMRVSDLLVDTVNGGVQESFMNEKRIELEIRALTATIARFAKQTDQWLAAYVEQEIGDFENWMKTMEFDCKSITTAICKIHQA
ncbi:hypothetical protein RJ639_002701 [Escallonia herrerae]|uniref:Biogenesis of lysosome-related organelles complex 1 subunit 1 n=1 Tax=Escallonia herrerae TaxID=1293975 RepID=A0AA88W2R0_9ASTE|nr:hypothetical protein RJ639_002701 [Escallonia herrerae]